MLFNENLRELVSYLKNQKIFLDFEEFKFQVETHPDHPSLLAFSDALTFFNVPNIAVKLSIEEIEQLPNSFVALLGKENQVVTPYHITMRNKLFYYKKDKEQIKCNQDELSKIWRGIIFLVVKPENIDSQIKSPNLFYLLLGFSIFILGLIYFFSHSISVIILGVFSILGIFLSVEALKTELGIESKVSQSFCNAIPNADCGQVINSDKSKWLQNFKISDISIWFFSAQIFALILFSVAGFTQVFFNYILFCLALSIPITLYSVYFQYKIEKKWCPICLSIIALVYVQLALLVFNFTAFSSLYNFKSLLLFLFSFSLIAFCVYLVKPLLLKVKNLKEENIKNLRFKRNYNAFKNNLQKEEQQFFEYENIILGNSNTKLRISIVTSPFCGYCKEAHEVLHKILLKNKENLSVSIRFNFDQNTSDKNNQLFYRLAEIHQEKGDSEFLDALHFWFENRNVEQWISKYGKPQNNDYIQEKLQIVGDENKNKELNFTPNIFINQYKFPKEYDRKDLEYFIADLIDDEEL